MVDPQPQQSVLTIAQPVVAQPSQVDEPHWIYALVIATLGVGLIVLVVAIREDAA